VPPFAIVVALFVVEVFFVVDLLVLPGGRPLLATGFAAVSKTDLGSAAG